MLRATGRSPPRTRATSRAHSAARLSLTTSTVRARSPETSQRLAMSRKPLPSPCPVARVSQRCLGSTATMTLSGMTRACLSARPMMFPSSTPRSLAVRSVSRTRLTKHTPRMAKRQRLIAHACSLVSQVMPSAEHHPLAYSRHPILWSTLLGTRPLSMPLKPT